MTSPLAAEPGLWLFIFLALLFNFYSNRPYLISNKRSCLNQISSKAPERTKKKKKKRAGGGPRSSRNEVILQKISHMLDEVFNGGKREEMKCCLLRCGQLTPTLGEKHPSSQGASCKMQVKHGYHDSREHVQSVKPRVRSRSALKAASPGSWTICYEIPGRKKKGLCSYHTHWPAPNHVRPALRQGH